MIFLSFEIINHIISQGSASAMNRILKLLKTFPLLAWTLIILAYTLR